MVKSSEKATESRWSIAHDDLAGCWARGCGPRLTGQSRAISLQWHTWTGPRGSEAEWTDAEPPSIAYQPVPTDEALAAAVTAVGVDGRAYFVVNRVVEGAGFPFASPGRLQTAHESTSSMVGMTVLGVPAGRQSEMMRLQRRQTN